MTNDEVQYRDPPDDLPAMAAAGILEHCRDWVWHIDHLGRFTYCSAACERLTGHAPEALIGRSYLSLVPPVAAGAMQRAFDAGRPFDRFRHGVLRADGSIATLEASAAPRDGGPGGYCGVDRDAAASCQVQGGALLPLGVVCAAAPVPLCLVDREGRYVALNGKLADVFGLAIDEVIGRPVADFSTLVAERVRRDFAAFDAGECVPDHETELRGRTFLVSVRPVEDDAGRATGLIAALMDITERRRAEQALAEANARLQAFAERDYLTGLLNRRRFDEIYAVEVSAARREQVPISLLIVDVDQFKLYNDYEGHLGGDECLRRVADAIGGAMSRPRDVVCRYGGEEFVAILPFTGVEGALVVAERVRLAVWDLAMPHPASLLGQVSVSIGVSTLLHIWPGDDMAARRRGLLAIADSALYEAKSSGRNAVRAGSPLGA